MLVGKTKFTLTNCKSKEFVPCKFHYSLSMLSGLIYTDPQSKHLKKNSLI